MSFWLFGDPLAASDVDLRPLRPPSPKVPRPTLITPLERPFPSPGRPIIQRHFQQHRLHGHHDQGLNEKSSVVAGAGPVEDLENRGEEHDQGDVEGEAGGGARAVDGEDLIGVGC